MVEQTPVGLPADLVAAMSEPSTPVQEDPASGNAAEATPTAPSAPAPAAAAGGEAEVGTLDIIGDALRGVADGALTSIESTGELIESGLEAVGIPSRVVLGEGADNGVIGLRTVAEWEAEGRTDPLFSENDAKDNAIPNPTTTAGNVTKGVSQFLTSLIGPAKLLAPFKAATATGKIAKAGGVGAIADFIGFDGDSGRLSDFLAENKSIRPYVIDYLITDEKDSDLEGRFKNALEGVVLGGAVDATFQIFKAIKGARKAVSDGGEEGLKKWAAENVEELEQLELKLSQSADDAPVSPSGIDIPDPTRVLNVSELDEAGKIAARMERQAPVTQANREAQGVTDSFFNNRPLVDTGAIEVGIVRAASDPTYADELANGTIFNHSKMDSPEAVQEVVKIVAEVQNKRIGELVKSGTKTFEEIRAESAQALSDVTGLGVDTILRSTAKIAETADQAAGVMKAAEAVVQSLSREALALSRKIESQMATNLDLTKFGLIQQQLGDLVGNLKAIKTGAARTTVAGRIRTSDIMTGKQVNTAFIADVIARGGNIDKLAKVIIANADNPAGIVKALDVSIARKILNGTQEFFINSLLSGPKTHIVNAVSNTIQTVVLPIEKMIGGTLTGSGADVKEGLQQFWFLRESFIDSARAAGKAFKMGDNVLDVSTKLDADQARVSITMDGESIFAQGFRMFGGMVRIPTRLLTTSDELFKQVNYRAALKARLHREASEKFGKNAKARAEYVQRKMESAFDADGRATDRQALDFAREATFTKPLEQGGAYVDIGRGLNNLVTNVPMLKFLAPFVKTPTNLFRQTVMRTPILGAFQKQMVDDIAAGGTRRSQAVGKQAMGMSVAGSALFMAQDGRMTGGGPADPEALKRLKATGWMPYSYVTQNDDGTRTYTQYSRLDPWGQLMGMTADVYTASSNFSDQEMDEIGVALGIAFARNFSQKSYVVGIADALEAWTSPDRAFKKWVGGMISGFVPTGAKQISQLAGVTDDPYMRETRSIIDKAISKIPGLSQTLPPKRDWVTGEAVKYPEGFLFPDAISPFPRSKRENNEVIEELARLQHGFRPPSRTMGAGMELDEKQYDRLQELHGTVKANGQTMSEALHELMQSDEYDIGRKTFPDEFEDPMSSRRVVMAQSVMSAYRELAEETLREEMPEVRAAFERSLRLRGGLLSGESDEPELFGEIRKALEKSQDANPFN